MSRSRAVTFLGGLFMVQDILRQLCAVLAFIVKSYFKTGHWPSLEAGGTLFVTAMKDVVMLHPILTVLFVCNVVIGWCLIQRYRWARHLTLHYSAYSALLWLFMAWRSTALGAIPHLFLYSITWVVLTRPAIKAQFLGNQ